MLYQINCSGNDDIPVSSFILFAQKDKVVGCGNHKVVLSDRKLRFSFFEVEYQKAHDPAFKEIITVRLMAILKFSTVQRNTSNIRVHFMALVLRMKHDQELVQYGPYIRLQYNLVGVGNKYLDLDIINFSAFHMPACVLQSPQLNSAIETQTIASAFNKNSVFYQIPSSRIVSLGAVHSYSSFDGQERSGDFLNPESLNQILSYYKLDGDDKFDLKSDKLAQRKDTLEDECDSAFDSQDE